MTPFGERVRQLRQERGRMLKDMAAHLGVSSAYLSALERGERGKPTWTLIQGVLQYFHIIWDEADELTRLADLSDPRVKIDTANTDPKATLLANRLAREIRGLTPEELDGMIALLDAAQERRTITVHKVSSPAHEVREGDPLTRATADGFPSSPLRSGRE
ncbi:helix-turn-helix domain-containing protein [Microvirga terrestris]|uniref:Helix-turn-helix transcriptional regulator n=1 Tax=Microvirga terrestris TaxID=2791024 RepID=A0ABS0HSZ6_9HYPH|nr:helix-turn-helix domain-containing protein [Microvirga terrestris]MBF9196597.1 helix-turn-helix transcriptional regulator [Microvirga terrestris]